MLESIVHDIVFDKAPSGGISAIRSQSAARDATKRPIHGRARMRPLRKTEFALLFLLAPALAPFLALAHAGQIAFWFMACGAGIALSMTRNFHWADLLPADIHSEWRAFALRALAFAAAVFALASALAPERLFDPDMKFAPLLIAYPLAVAAPVELVYRALFFRRFGEIFAHGVIGVAAGGLVNGLGFYLLTGSLPLGIFGAAIGLAIGQFYWRSGQFLLSVLLHWAAAASIWLIGPGLMGL